MYKMERDIAWLARQLEQNVESVDEFMQKLPDYDHEIAAKMAAAEANGNKLIFVGVVDVARHARHLRADAPAARVARVVVDVAEVGLQLEARGGRRGRPRRRRARRREARPRRAEQLAHAHVEVGARDVVPHAGVRVRVQLGAVLAAGVVRLEVVPGVRCVLVTSEKA